MNVPSLDRVSVVLDLGVGTLRILLGVAAAMALGTVLRGVAVWRRPSPTTRDRWRSVGTWWALLGGLVLVLVLGRPAVVTVLALVSLLALREAAGLAGDGGALPWLAAAALALYAWAWLDWVPLYTRVLPALVLLAVVGEVVRRLSLAGRPGPDRVRGLAHAFLSAVVGPSFAVAVASLPAPDVSSAGPLGWLVLLLVLTELNDMAQAWWGRALGSRPLAPVLSPRKTWEGVWGGLATTVAAALVLAPLVTPWGRVAIPGPGVGIPAWFGPVTVGVAIALTGVAGDLFASVLKRRAGVRHSGDLLPGQGGILDRLDSLSATAPAFFALSWLLQMARP